MSRNWQSFSLAFFFRMWYSHFIERMFYFIFLIGGDHIQMKIQQNMSLMEKLTILSDAAKYDVACTSSGVDRGGDGIGLGNSISCGICHTFSADGRCVSLLKILFTNECIFNCSYCQNNCNSDVRRAAFTPEEVCELTMEFYRRHYGKPQLYDGTFIPDPL